MSPRTIWRVQWWYRRNPSSTTFDSLTAARNFAASLRKRKCFVVISEVT